MKIILSLIFSFSSVAVYAGNDNGGNAIILSMLQVSDIENFDTTNAELARLQDLFDSTQITPPPETLLAGNDNGGSSVFLLQQMANEEILYSQTIEVSDISLHDLPKTNEAVRYVKSNQDLLIFDKIDSRKKALRITVPIDTIDTLMPEVSGAIDRSYQNNDTWIEI